MKPAIQKTLLSVTTDPDGPLIVLLHGFAGAPADLEPFARSIGVGAKFVFPVGPVDLSSTDIRGSAWWPSDGAARSEAINSGIPRDLSDFEPEGLQVAHEALGELLDSLTAEYPGSPLVLGGFSQGAMLAFDIAFRSRRQIAGLVQLSGAHIARRLWDPQLASRAGTPVFLSHGREDPDLSFSAAESFASDLSAAGLLVDFCPFDGGHEVPLVALRRLKRFLRGVTAPRR